jgi:hypothetical protein
MHQCAKRRLNLSAAKSPSEEDMHPGQKHSEVRFTSQSSDTYWLVAPACILRIAHTWLCRDDAGGKRAAGFPCFCPGIRVLSRCLQYRILKVYHLVGECTFSFQHYEFWVFYFVSLSFFTSHSLSNTLQIEFVVTPLLVVPDMAPGRRLDGLVAEKSPTSVGVDSVPSSPGESDREIGAHRDDDIHIKLGWKTWLVVFITCFGYVVTAIAEVYDLPTGSN